MTTGVHTRLGWKREGDAEFADDNTTIADTAEKNFGANETLQTNQGSNNMTQVLAPGSNVPVDTLEMMFEGSFTVNFTVTNPWWIELFLSAPGSPTDNLDGSYTYAFSGLDPSSFQIMQAYDESAYERVLRGCVVQNASLDLTVNQPATVTLQGLYADEQLIDQSAGSIFTQPTDDERAMTFAQGSVAVGGTTQTLVQSATLQANPATTFVRGVGSRFAADYNPHVLQPQLQLTKYMVDGNVDDIEEMYGDSTTPASEPEEKMTNKVAATLTLDNGETGADKNTMTLTASGTLTDNYSESGFGDPTADIMENINRFVEGLSASATNSNATAP